MDWNTKRGKIEIKIFVAVALLRYLIRCEVEYWYIANSSDNIDVLRDGVFQES